MKSNKIIKLFVYTYFIFYLKVFQSDGKTFKFYFVITNEVLINNNQINFKCILYSIKYYSINS